ncbi:hypothetical protein MMC25_005749 [Agyrium rufum]|nr:hypothetical protein [Agyrium rufum]
MSGQSGSELDQIVKGAAPLGTSVDKVASRIPSQGPPGIIKSENPDTPPSTRPGHVSDPLASLPSSPPQIYLNLLILEASLRSQYLDLRDRRRQNTFFVFLLTIWNAFFIYALFLRPREDGSGVGGSVYWVIETTEKVALMGGIVTALLIWGTGQYERGVRWPKRFVAVANRGLRTMNAKIVVIKGPWWKELLSHLIFLFPYTALFPSQSSSYHYVPPSPQIEKRNPQGKVSRWIHDDDLEVAKEEDLSFGGDHIKLLLLPKPFSPDFRENWELYRSEYWEKENERRAALLRRVKQADRRRAKELGGWLWWTGWRGWRRPTQQAREADVEKTHPLQRHTDRDMRHHRLAASVRRGDSHSRNSSRSSTPGGGDSVDGSRPRSVRTRRESQSNSTSGPAAMGESRRRPKLSGMKSNEQLSSGPGSGNALGDVVGMAGTAGTAVSPRSLLRRADSSYVGSSSGNDSDRSYGVVGEEG